MGGGHAQHTLSGQFPEDLRGCGDPFNSAGSPQDFIDAGEHRSPFVRCVQDPFQGADLHDKITLPFPQAVPERHGGVDPETRCGVFPGRHCTDSLAQNCCQGAGLQESGLAGGVGPCDQNGTGGLQVVGDRPVEQGMDHLPRIKSARIP